MSVSQVSSSNYELSRPFWKFYTGTENQPDTVSIFYKDGDEKNTITIADEEVINSLGHSLFNFRTAIERILPATSEIFEIIRYGTSKHNDTLANAFANLGRGLVQLVPLAGNATLYLYDKVRTNFFIHPQIKAALADEKEPVIGIAFDGKIITKFISEKLKTVKDPLTVAQYCWYSMQKLALEKNLSKTRLQLVETFNAVLG
jgi:hypothetical protein